MIFKDKEILNYLAIIERKLDILIALKKTSKIKEAAKRIKEDKNVSTIQ